MNERSVPGLRWIHACAADELGMGRLHAVYSLADDPCVVDRVSTVMVEVVHHAVVIAVDEDVRGISIHMPAQSGTATRVAPALVVLRRPESAHHRHTGHVDPA